MPRGGYRPGAGRPKGAKSPKVSGTTAADIRRNARDLELTPLAFMLKVMNDPTEDADRRLRMAIAAAPYCHPKAADEAGGKKAQADAEAETAHLGTTWEDLLN